MVELLPIKQPKKRRERPITNPMKGIIIHLSMLGLMSCTSKVVSAKHEGGDVPIAPFLLKIGAHIGDKIVNDGIWNQWGVRNSSSVNSALYVKNTKNATYSFNVQIDENNTVLEEVSSVFIKNKMGCWELRRCESSPSLFHEHGKFLPKPE